MPNRLLAVLTVVAAVTLAGCGGNSDDSASDSPGSSAAAPVSGAVSGAGSGPCQYPTDGTKPAKAVTPPPSTPTVSGKVTATLDTTIGTLTFTLDADTAPCTVNSFVSLAKQGFFDSSPCFRLTEAQMTGIAVLQCGDPTGTGLNGPGYRVQDELDGNTGSYPPGTLAMANTGQPDTNGSQFFIVYGDSQLTPSYTIFGTVDAAGLQAVQKAAQAGTDNSHGQGDGQPNTPVEISSVKIG